jgi:hypothetical protein
LTVLVDDDLHDLHDLRARLLVFIHSLLESLRESGVSPNTPSWYFNALNAHLFADSRLLRISAFQFTSVLNLRFASRSERVRSQECRHRSLPKCKLWKKVCTHIILTNTTYNADSLRDNVLLGELEHGPVLIIT